MRRRLTIVAVSVLLAVLAAAGIFKLARSRTTQLFGRLVPRVDTSERVVALTFDDGPSAERADQVLAALGDVRATFFVTGADLRNAPLVAPRLVAAGHELGNHSFSHVHMVLRSQAFLRSEIEDTDRLIRAAGERGEIFFRPPYCWKLLGLPWFLSRTGRTSVTWDVEPDSDLEIAAQPERIVEHVSTHVRPGSIVLLHVWWGRETSLAAVPGVIRALRSQGYRFVTVGELLNGRS